MKKQILFIHSAGNQGSHEGSGDVEVFKTNVKDRGHANMLIDQIHKTFMDYQANFDLEDCDKILRIQCTKGFIQSCLLINLLKDFGCTAEVLPEEDPADIVANIKKKSSLNDLCKIRN